MRNYRTDGLQHCILLLLRNGITELYIHMQGKITYIYNHTCKHDTIAVFSML